MTSASPRPTGKYGRKPPSNKPALMLAPALTGTIPPHPASEDALLAFTGWKMLGNDEYGDCVAVTAANGRALVTTVLTGTTHYPALSAVEAFYKTQNPGFPSQDDGMDEQTACEALIKVGIDGAKAIAFAKVDHTNLDEVKAALAIFGCLMLGIVVKSANETEFNQGQPWDASTTAEEGGHGVLAGGYLSQSTDDVRFITWGAETGFTDAFWAEQVEEAWVIIWPEHFGSKAFLDGVNLTVLAADYQALTGKVLPIPVPEPPAPTPTPVPEPPAPTPVPSDPDAVFVAAAESWITHRHSGANHTFATEVHAWLVARGFISAETGPRVPGEEQVIGEGDVGSLGDVLG